MGLGAGFKLIDKERSRERELRRRRSERNKSRETLEVPSADDFELLPETPLPETPMTATHLQSPQSGWSYMLEKLLCRRGVSAPSTSSSSTSPPAAHISPHGRGPVRVRVSSPRMRTHSPQVKLEDGSQHKNHRIFSVSTGEELTSFSQRAQEGWDMQYTISESHAIRLVGPEIQVFRPSEWSKGIVDKLRVEGATSVSLSPGLNPSVAVFIAEKKVRGTIVTPRPSTDNVQGRAREHQGLLATDAVVRAADVPEELL